MSDVTICNLALSHLGDTAVVASISPPDASVQAQLCARFYPMARDALLEMANWGFATKRAVLAQLAVNPTLGANGNGPWQYAYAVPSDLVNALALVPSGSADDYEAHFGPMDPLAPDPALPYPEGYLPVPGAPVIVPQSFAIETQANGTQMLLTNVGSSDGTVNAVLRYTAAVTDTTQFTPLFTMALGYLLASMLAGPLLKGDAGVTAAEQMLQLFEAVKGKATSSDANQRKTRLEPATPWIRGR